jgi:bacteriophage N4 adsorption protein B
MLAGDFLAYVLVITQFTMMVVCTIFLISGLDDLFIDVCFFVRALYRRIFILPYIRPMSEQDLLRHPEQPIAVMIPAWDESAVIRPMLLNTVRSLRYRNFHIFVGTYPNDLATHREVEAVTKSHSNVHRVVTPHDGPTNKADCLNWIYQEIRLFEKESGIRFEIFVMQDCEDVIHPLCYKLFNYLIPRKDMVQLPVHSLHREWNQFTAAHYADEFAQLHYKDLVVRESLSGSIPAAGVGCAFSRRAVEAVAAGNSNVLFRTDSLTEDYDFGFRLKQYGLKQIFVRFAVRRSAPPPSGAGARARPVVQDELLCIREYFPASFCAAVKQKSRWVLGIALQGWAHIGWQGGFWIRYMLYRDRKALITNLINLLGYVVALVVLTVWLIIWIDPDAYRYPPLVEKGSVLWYVILANAALLAHRLVMRTWCTQRLHGWLQAGLSIPRMVWGNVINFCATCRAIKLYARYLRSGKRVVWDKTRHAYPSETQLGGFRRKLGDLLLERRMITVTQLDEALNLQKEDPRLLGAILLEMGLIGEHQLSEVLEAS